MSESPKAWTLQERDGVAILELDVPNERVNTLSAARVEELAAHLDDLARRTDLKALLVVSGKPKNFIAGVDLKEVQQLFREPDPDQSLRLSARGQEVFNRFAELPFPSIAVIHGAAVGGGLELALACDYRICSIDAATQLGLPETQIGIIPGWGGTQRLPRIVGVSKALEMITSGQSVDGPTAATIGLVWDAVPQERLLEEAERLVEIVTRDDQWRTRREQMAGPIGLTEDQLQFIVAVTEGMLAQRVDRRHYPAPYVAIDTVRRTVNLPLSEGLEIERRAIAPLLGSPTSRELVHVFFATRRVEKNPGGGITAVEPRKVETIAVIGAGVMGSAITSVMARKGYSVILVDLNRELLDHAIGRIDSIYDVLQQRGRMNAKARTLALGRIAPLTDLNAVRSADFVLEAIVEREDAKKELYRKLSDIVAPDCVIASNTSTISISRLAEAVAEPARFAGMHFFNPAERMRLVEVIRGEQSAPETLATIAQLARSLGKTPVVVGDCAGFLVNRILVPYMLEALILLEEGVPPTQIDRVAKDFGMPMGPILLHDVVGLDVALYASRVLAAAYGDRFHVPRILEVVVEAGRLGQKNNVGFYRYRPGKTKGQPDPELDKLIASVRTGTGAPPADDVIEERLFLSMLAEAIRCLEDKIVDDAEHLDMALLLGIGFPPFRGGLLRWADQLGARTVLEKLQKYEPLGARFRPPELLRALARDGGRFYPDG